MAGKIILKVFLVIVIIIVVFAIIMFISAKTLLKAHHGDKAEVLKADVEKPQKALVIYQPSKTSASSDVAHAIAEGLHDSGYEVTLNHPGDFLSSDISGYSVVVFGAPVYGSMTADVLTEYMQRIGDFSDKKVILFFTAGSIDDGPEMGKLEALLHGTEPFASVKFKFTDGEANKQKAYQLGLDAAGED
jgi:flavodoxin